MHGLLIVYVFINTLFDRRLIVNLRRGKLERILRKSFTA